MTNEPIKISQAARIYADALIELAKSGKMAYDALFSDLQIVNDAFLGVSELVMVLENPAVDSDVKIDIINTVFSGKISQELINFLKILVEKKRVAEFPSIYAEFNNKFNKIQNIQSVTIVSAIELSKSQQDEILARLSTKLNKKIIPVWETDESIIAGLTVKIDDNVLDMSLKNRLEKLGKSLMLK